jgi:hypothetical protein
MAVINVTPLMDITELIASDNVNAGDVLLLEDGIYHQTVNIAKNNIRIAAKGPEVIFDGRSTLGSAFTLSNVTRVVIAGIKMRHYRFNGVLIASGYGNRIIQNIISNTLSNAIDVRNSSGNLIWKNEICNCFDAVRFIFGSTSNWVIENIAKDCFDDGFECFLDPDSNNAFISNKAIGNAANGIDMFGSNNLALNNILIGNGLALVTSNGSNSVVIGNVMKDTMENTLEILTGYVNHFSGENHIVCNTRSGIRNNGQLGTFLNNEICYNGNSGMMLDTPSSGNLVMDNILICNIPGNITNNGTDNYLISNIVKPCGPCEAPGVVCSHCTDQAENGSN